MTRVTTALALAFALAFAAADPGVAAQGKVPPTGAALEALTVQVASQLRCPVCRALSVQDSQAELSRKVKDVIRERLATGESPEEVKAYFVSKYGEWILLSPPKHGVTLLVWVLPLVALLGGGGVLALFLRRWLGGGGGEASFTPASASLHSEGAIVPVKGIEPPDHWPAR